MKKSVLILAVLFLFISCKKETSTSTTPSSTTESSAAIPSDQDIVDAYTYLYGRYLVIQQENHDINVEKVGYNKIKYNTIRLVRLNL